MRPRSIRFRWDRGAVLGVVLLMVSACAPALITPTGQLPTAVVSPLGESARSPAGSAAQGSPSPTDTSAPEWSDSVMLNLPAGEYIATLQLVEPATSAFRPSVLSLLSRDGHPVGILATTFMAQSRLSPEADRIAFNIPGTGGIRIHTFASGETIDFLTEHFVLSPSWYPDASFILALVDDDLAVVDPSTGRLMALAKCHLLLKLDQPDCLSSSISPDGKWIAVAYIEGNNAPPHPSPEGIYVFPADCLLSSACSQLPRKVPLPGSLVFAWAPNGDAIAIGTSYIFDASTWMVVKKLPHPSFTSGVLWSPDGRYLASTDGYSVTLIDLGTGNARQVYQSDTEMYLEFWISVGGGATHSP